MARVAIRSFSRHIVQNVASLLIVMPMAGGAHAADASAWDKGLRSAVRLIAASATMVAGEPALRAGIEIRLDPGWKTYWRHPGDSGVPPRFDFARSDNVKTIEVQWPAPHRFPDGSGHSIGYKDQVILPLAIVPQNVNKPVTVRLRLDYAICEKLCVPVDAKAELTVSRDRTPHEAALTAAQARVPKRSTLGAASLPAITAVQREASGRIVVDVAAKGSVDLFAEGPTPEWALPLPEPVEGTPASGAAVSVRRFSFALDGLPAGARAAGAVLTLTAVAADSAVEVTHRLE
jgi:DsbC/DsbD-like thiol-disulfide interchange protein